MQQASATHHQNARRRPGGDFLPVATRVMWALIAVAGLLTLGFTFYPEWTRLCDMRRDLAAQKEKLAELKRKCADQEEQVKLLQNDPQYLEIIARDKLDLMKQGETIFRLSSATPSH